eukprot:1040696_1
MHIIKNFSTRCKVYGNRHDEFNPGVTASLLDQTSCDGCMKYFPSKKMMLNHRRVLHPRVRFATNDEDNAQEDGDVDYESLLSELELEFYERIDRICDERDGEYLALMMCGSKRWVMLDESDAKVKEYLSRRYAKVKEYLN